MDNKETVEHHGIKGMKWGSRGSGRGPTSVSVKTGSSPSGMARIKTGGGEHQPAHPDSVAARTVQQQLKKSGSHSLSNEQMRTLTERANLEQQVARLKPPTHLQRSLKGASTVHNFLRSPQGKTTVDAAKAVVKSGSVKKKLAQIGVSAALAAA